MHCLVTGGAGFIGSHLTEALLNAGHRVTVVDDLSTGSLDNIRDFRTNPDFVFIEDSVSKTSAFDSLPGDIDLIFHLAAAVGVRYILDNPLDSIQTNIHGTENVLDFALKRMCKVVFTSTSEVYGKNPDSMMKEGDDRVCGATSVSRWSYACAKALDEFIAFAYIRQYELPVVITRLFNTCGPRQTGRYGMVLPTFIRQSLAGETITVYGTGDQIRSFTYVEDTVRGLIALSENEDCVGEVFNIGGREPISIQGLAERIKYLTESDSEIKKISYAEAYGHSFEDMQRRVPDISKIKKFTGFVPSYGLDQILEKTINHIKEELDVSSKKTV